MKNIIIQEIKNTINSSFIMNWDFKNIEFNNSDLLDVIMYSYYNFLNYQQTIKETLNSVWYKNFQSISKNGYSFSISNLKLNNFIYDKQTSCNLGYKSNKFSSLIAKYKINEPIQENDKLILDIDKLDNYKGKDHRNKCLDKIEIIKDKKEVILYTNSTEILTGFRDLIFIHKYLSNLDKEYFNYSYNLKSKNKPILFSSIKFYRKIMYALLPFLDYKKDEESISYMFKTWNCFKSDDEINGYPLRSYIIKYITNKESPKHHITGNILNVCYIYKTYFEKYYKDCPKFNNPPLGYEGARI